MHFQWYPGHMTKARRQMQEDIKLIDLENKIFSRLFLFQLANGSLRNSLMELIKS